MMANTIASLFTSAISCSTSCEGATVPEANCRHQALGVYRQLAFLQLFGSASVWLAFGIADIKPGAI
jgi:hypothetical protein